MSTKIRYLHPEIPDKKESAKRVWSINETSTQPRVSLNNLTKGTICVPLTANDQVAEDIRFHEMLHIRKTPNNPDLTGINSSSLLQAVEDMRINTIGSRLKARPLTLTYPYQTESLELLVSKTTSLQEAVETLICIHSTDILKRLKEASKRNENKEVALNAIPIAEKANALLISSDWSFERSTIRIVKYLQELFKTIEEKREKSEEKDSDLTPKKGDIDHKKLFSDTELTDHTGRFIPWGKMTIEKPPLLLPAIKGFHRERKKSKELGQIIYNISRLPIDRKIFLFKHKRNFGDKYVIAIDQSGSMGLSNRNLQTLLDLNPIATIARYYGVSDFGFLTILATNGKKIKDIPRPLGGANVIDLPVLKWLGKQKGIKIWICDGLVTGVDDQSGEINILQCKRECIKSKITRYSSLEEFIKFLKEKKEVKG